MPRKKLNITATPEELEDLYKALEVGTPITVALQMVGIGLATYYYWVAVYSVVVYVKEQEELEKIEQLTQAGISIQEVKDLSASTSQTYRKAQVGTYIEPKQETVLQYKNSLKFRKFANEVYEIIHKCNQIRSKVIVKHLDNIDRSTDNKNHIKASGSMWFLERTLSGYFGREIDKQVVNENTSGDVPKVQIEFIDPNTDDERARLEELETEVLKELKGSGEA